MYRRTMLSKSLAMAAASALGLALTQGNAHAQQPAKVYRVGVLINQGALVNGNPHPQMQSLRAGMAQLGYTEGTQIVYEPRYAEGQLDRLPGFAAELVASNVDVIVAYGGPPSNAARKASTTVPIVVVLVADPVAIGVAASLEKPGGNITGVTNNDTEIAGLHMALLKEMMPKLTKVAILSDLDIPGADASGLAPIERANIAAARAAGLTPQMLKVRGPKPDFEAVFKSIASEGSEALVVLEVPVVFNIPKTVADMATANRIPTMIWGGQGAAGGLMSYGTSFTANYPRVPVYVDKILKGTKTADIPFEVVSKRELVINLKTAKDLGLTVPAALLKRADRIID
jgi:putative tryptophan/tyrosine transport system substrate-binding protein